MRAALKHMVVAGLAFAALSPVSLADDGVPQVPGGVGPLHPVDPLHEQNPPTHIGRDFHEQDEEDADPTTYHGSQLSEAMLHRSPEVHQPLPGERKFKRSPPSHADGRRAGRRRPNDAIRHSYKKGDGSKASHAYDYLYDELTELREELVDTEDTFGHDSDDVHEILAKIRLLEQIRRNAKVGCAPQCVAVRRVK